MKRGTRSQAQERIEASPEVVYDLVTDVARMGEWSPECIACEWIGGADGPVPGARFRGRNQNRLARWSTQPRVVVASRPVEFSFVAGDLFRRDLTTWTYRMEADGSGTVVTESFELLRDIPWYLRLWRRSFMGVKDRRSDLEVNMEHTLVGLKSVAELTS
jgi:ribosome-associated toxin RatA of RatAB toxin-antitoxin module